jgi:hypothetical protein
MIRLLVNPHHTSIWLEFALFRHLRASRYRELVVCYEEEYGTKSLLPVFSDPVSRWPFTENNMPECQPESRPWPEYDNAPLFAILYVPCSL